MDFPVAVMPKGIGRKEKFLNAVVEFARLKVK